MKFTLATCVRNEGPYLLEWIVHHKLLGFERIVIFSNDNDDGSDELLAEFANQKLIDWRPRKLEPGESPQGTAFRAFSQELFEDNTEHNGYLAWFDCDEFLVLKKHSTVQELLAQYDFPDSLFINWKFYGSANKKKYEPDLTICRFNYCDSMSYHNKFGKSISKIRPDIYEYISNHRAVPKTDNAWGRIIYATNQPSDVFVDRDVVYGNNPKKNSNFPIFHDVCQLNHYAIRSREEYQWKAIRGNGRQPVNDKEKQFKDRYFRIHDLNTEEDDYTAQKYYQAINNAISLLPPNLQIKNKAVIDNIISLYRSKLDTDLVISKSEWLSEEQQRDLLNGCALEAVEKRLSFISFVGSKKNYVFVSTEKAACSTMKWIITDLENKKVQNRHIGNQSSSNMVIHLRSNYGVKSLMDYKDTERLNLIHQNDIIRFCVVRNPYARLVSAWADKIRQKEPGYGKIWESIADYFGSDPKTCPSFSQFVRWIVETQSAKTCDPHWRPMVNILLPKLINYTHILHTEKFELEFQNVLNLIAPDKNAKALLEKYRTNESLPVGVWQSYYDSETAELVSKWYREDFYEYGYLPDSWKPLASLQSPNDEISHLREQLKSYEHAALEAIRSKNDFISNLIKLRGVTKKINKSPAKKVAVLGGDHIKIFESPSWQKITPNLLWDTLIFSDLASPDTDKGKKKNISGFELSAIKPLLDKKPDVVLISISVQEKIIAGLCNLQQHDSDQTIAIKQIADDYCHFIEAAHKKVKVLVLSSPLPTLNIDKNILIKYGNTDIACLEITRAINRFNSEIDDWCSNNGIDYVNLDDALTGTDGLLLTEFAHTNVNSYDQKNYRKLLRKNLLPVIEDVLYC